MRRKREIISIALILSLIAIVASGTLAYFTDSVTSHNVITTSGVGIKLDEKTKNDQGNLIDWPEEGISNVVPGLSIDKIVKLIADEDSSDAWVRIKVTIEIKSKDGEELPIALDNSKDVITLDFDTDNWTNQGDWWYYNTKISAAEETSPLFTTATFNSDLGNQYQGAKATITVQGQAVQAKNNGSTALEAAGWPEE